ncbi:MAG: hypothetical protein HDT28_07045 [Clostridiales bacterium]|nr:hypothetical protein [Clostridiales bacterium]
MIYLVVAVLFLHLISLPLVVTMNVDIDYDNDYGLIKFKLWFFTVYKKSVNIGAVKQKLEGIVVGDESKKTQEEEKSGIKPATKRFLVSLSKRMIERVRVRDLDLDLRLGTGDAAVSAFIVGMLKISFESACAIFGIDKEKAVFKPIYDNEYIFLEFFGIFSLSFADIIYAVCATLIGLIPQRRSYANTVTE